MHTTTESHNLDTVNDDYPTVMTDAAKKVQDEIVKVNLFFSHWDIEDKLGTGLNECEKMQIAIGKGVETLPEVTHELEQLRVVTERTRGLMEEQRLECKKAWNKGTKEYKQMRRGFNERIAESSKQDTIDWFKSVVTEAATRRPATQVFR